MHPLLELDIISAILVQKAKEYIDDVIELVIESMKIKTHRDFRKIILIGATKKEISRVCQN